MFEWVYIVNIITDYGRILMVVPICCCCTFVFFYSKDNLNASHLSTQTETARTTKYVNAV